MGIYQDNKDAMEFFRNSKQLESNGKWQEFVEQSELEAAVHEPRNMELAKASPWDYTSNVNNPGLEQTEVLRPGETLEEWEPNPFLKPHAEGGRAGYNDGQLVTPNVDGSRPGYSGLPAFVQQNTGNKKNPYRVRVKPNEKLGREGFEGKFSSLKKATAKAAEFSDVVTETRNKRYTTLKELVIESNKGSKHVSMKALAEKAGIPSRDQNFTRQLKNFNIPKLDTAADKAQKEFLKIIKNPDLPIEEVFSLVKKVSNKTGLGRSKVSHHLLKLPEYKEASKMLKTLAQAEFQKKIADKGFTLGDFQEIVEQKKNVPKLQVSNISTPEKFIIDSAMRHEQQGGNKIKFIKRPGDIDKEGDLITHRDAEFKYKGKKHSYFSLLKDGRKLDDFKEVYKAADEMNDLLGREVVHPKTKEKVLFKDLMKESYNKGAGYTYTRSPYDIDHFKSVKGEPFKNLRVIPRRINTSEGILSNLADSAKKGFLPKAADLYSPEKVKAYRKKMGYEFTKDINKLFADELKLADDILIKGRVLKKPLDIAKETFNIKPKQFTLGSNLANVDADMFDFRKLPDDVRHFADITKRYAAQSPKLLSALKKAKGAGKWTGWALAGEAAFAAPFAEYGYKMGDSPERILGDATFGLFGETEKEELKKATGEIGYATHQIDNYGSQLGALEEKWKSLNDQNDPRGEKRQMVKNLYEHTRGKYSKAYNTFVDDQGKFDKGKYDQALNNYTAGLVQIDKFKKQKQDERIEKAGGYEGILQEREIRNIKGYASGGLTRTVARDSEGIMSLKKWQKKTQHL